MSTITPPITRLIFDINRDVLGECISARPDVRWVADNGFIMSAGAGPVLAVGDRVVGEADSCGIECDATVTRISDHLVHYVLDKTADGKSPCWRDIDAWVDPDNGATL